MPGAPFPAADTLEPPSVTCATPATATRSFDRRPDEVPAARRFVRDALGGHPASFDAELLTCELVTNAVQHATDAGWVTVAVMNRGEVVHVDVIDDGRGATALPGRGGRAPPGVRPGRSGLKGRGSLGGGTAAWGGSGVRR